MVQDQKILNKAVDAGIKKLIELGWYVDGDDDWSELKQGLEVSLNIINQNDDIIKQAPSYLRILAAYYVKDVDPDFPDVKKLNDMADQIERKSNV